jgi:hypothetical protein
MATAPVRIYLVSEGMQHIGLVRARNKSEAIRHCTFGRFGAEVAKQDALIEAIGNGLTVETAKAEPEAA